MRYIQPEELTIFHQNNALEKTYKESEKKWLEMVEESHKGKIVYEDTKPQFDEYIAAHKIWQEFFYKHMDVLLAQEIK